MLDVVLEIVLGIMRKTYKHALPCPCMEYALFKSVHNAGNCELCSKCSPHLERHHIRYRPEITIWLCHACHFRCHFQPYALTERELFIMLCRVYKPETLIKYKGNLRRLLSLSLSHSHDEKENFEVAPSRKGFLLGV
jgi:hypothetical protein